ncbi:MAG: PIN domain-containing protein [Actinobacteria bacterium]|nr:PIN domain-containing protein [Actinomycetota bacterium]
MILVDTSVWVDHFHRGDVELEPLLVQDLVWTHELVLEELALGSMRRRERILEDLHALRRANGVDRREFMAFVESRKAGGKGLSVVDVHLLAATLITPGLRLWTRDKRLLLAAEDEGIAYREARA